MTASKTSVSEAVSNSIIHGYAGGSVEKYVSMEMSYDEKGTVTIEVSDSEES